MIPLTTRFQTVFLVTLATSTLLRAALTLRQQHRVETCPGVLADSVPVAYTRAKLQLERIEILLSGLVTTWLLVGGGLTWFAAHWHHYRTATAGTLFLLALAGMLALLDLPVDAYRTFRIEARFDFNRTSVQLWLQDLAKASLLSVVLLGPLLYLLLRLIMVAGRYWWLYASAVLVLLQVILVWIYPTWVAPLFNKFESLPEGPLRTQAQDLLARNRISSAGLFVANGSLRSTHGNAYVAGFGRRRRIVFFDTLLTRLSPEEACAVLAHEVGHVRRHHVLKQLALAIPSTVGSLAALAWLAQKPWFYGAFGLVPAVPLAVAVMLLAAPPFLFFVRPLFAAISRRYEYEADDFAQREGVGDALAHALLRLYQDNASPPCQDPWYVAFHYTHPPANERTARLQGPTPRIPSTP